MSLLEQELDTRLCEHRSANLYRTLRPRLSPQGSECVYASGSLINFSSNDYLGFANHPAVIAAFKNGANQYGVGSGAANTLSGYTQAHEALEHALADYLGYESALVFNSGYMGNVGLIDAIANKNTAIFQDKLNHASLLDGARLSGATLYRYTHLNYERLADLLDKIITPQIPGLIISESIFSMDGDIADCKQLSHLAHAKNAALYIDDSHGFGVLAQGRGVLQAQGLASNDVPFYFATFGKSLGAFGAFVAARLELIDALRQFVRPFLFTTALPPAVACAALCSLQLLQSNPEINAALWRNIDLFRTLAKHHQLNCPAIVSPIIPIIIGDSERCLAISAQLRELGFHVPAIRPPTVAPKSARLRISLSAVHTPSHIEALIDALVPLLK